MLRFRFTLIAFGFVLLYLGYNDASLTLRNQEPLTIDLRTLINEGAPREWLHITGGHQNLDEAISTSGQAERFDAMLIPLVPNPEDSKFHVLVETRDPELLEFLYTYHFEFDSVFARERFREEEAETFRAPWEVTGMLTSGRVAANNREKLFELAEAVDLNISDNVVLVTEGKTPARFRGFFFLAMGAAGLIKGLLMFRRPSTKPTTPQQADNQ